MLVLREGKGSREEADGFALRAELHAAFQITEPAQTEGGACGEFLLRQTGGEAVSPEQIGERGRSERRQVVRRFRWQLE
jgi:hypothetical protein